jgi:hypothetical protein
VAVWLALLVRRQGEQVAALRLVFLPASQIVVCLIIFGFFLPLGEVGLEVDMACLG